MNLPKSPKELINYSDEDLAILRNWCLRAELGDDRKYLGWIEEEIKARHEGANIVSLGARLSPKFIHHIGINTAMAHALYPKKGPTNFQPCIGGPLTDELFDLITKQAGCNRIAVLWHQKDIELGMIDCFRRCIVTLSADDPGSKLPIGHVINVYQNKWIKGETWYGK